MYKVSHKITCQLYKNESVYQMSLSQFIANMDRQIDLHKNFRTSTDTLVFPSLTQQINRLMVAYITKN